MSTGGYENTSEMLVYNEDRSVQGYSSPLQKGRIMQTSKCPVRFMSNDALYVCVSFPVTAFQMNEDRHVTLFRLFYAKETYTQHWRYGSERIFLGWVV